VSTSNDHSGDFVRFKRLVAIRDQLEGCVREGQYLDVRFMIDRASRLGVDDHIDS